MMRLRAVLLLAAATFMQPALAQSSGAGQAGQAVLAEAAGVPAELAAAASKLRPRQGRISIAQAKATLDLGTAYDFYDANDARTILTDLWGNPPAASEGVLGLVMPAGASPLSDSWGAVVTYEDTGYVSDADAGSVDYNALLAQMREGEADDNAAARSAGYPEAHLIGWAERPSYDAAAHAVIWAREIRFSNAANSTLNYDVRTLGRSGVLSLNLVSTMARLDEVRAAGKAFARHAAFDAGARYADYDPASDRAAEYGIGGLVAAGVGLAAAKKLGIAALLLKFIKPILLGIAVLFGLLRRKLAGLWSRMREVTT